MKVKAAPGINVPKEDKPREYITDAEVVDVPDTAYYLRRVAEGDLIDATNPLSNSLPQAGDGANVKSTKTTTKGAA